jgi:hypothetical protein
MSLILSIFNQRSKNMDGVVNAKDDYDAKIAELIDALERLMNKESETIDSIAESEAIRDYLKTVITI